ncbi:MAG TPA: carboxypeptidase regulatory-like domain-containing protein [Pyrinomonadaceae bacterium]|nr:carboxypeptidase regulatory-like domain-containing protein [Pyrinomonadaceae bacterium]
MNANTRRHSRARSRFDAPERQPKLCVALSRALVWLPALLFSALLAADASAQTRADASSVESRENRMSGAITGRIVGEDGQPLSNVRVFALRVGGAPAFSFASAFTDAEGKFALRSLASGAYSVNASAPGYLLDPDPSDQSGGRTYHHVGDSLALRMIKGGVITGTVTDANGEPVVGLFVEAARVRHADGRALREGSGGRMWQPRQTDDRGVYRIYGLRAGAYIIRAGGRSSFGLFTPYDLNAPTFYPSTTRDTATEVNVQAGQEMSGIDIRYRGEAGRTISGTVSGALPPNFASSGGILIALKHASAAAPELFLSLSPGNNGFAFDGIADGDYDLLARTNSPRDEPPAASPPRRVRLRGTDATGIALALTPLASVSGQLSFDPPDATDAKVSCRPARVARASEFIVALTRRDEPGSAADQSSDFFNNINETAPDDKGAFQLRYLRGGRHQLLVRPPDADSYVRAITLARAAAQTTPAAPNAPAKSAPTAKTASPNPKTASPPAQVSNDAARNGLNLQAGERLTGLSIHVASGASSLRGRVVASTESAAAAGASPDSATAGAAPDNANASVSADTVNASASSEVRPLRVYLVPAEREQAENVLRYAESRVEQDGAFAFNNLSPGRYLLLARPAPDAPDDTPRTTLAQETDARARLRREAETANVTLSLAPCQRLTDFVLRRAAR